MAYETKENSGALFNNDKKQQEKHPDFTGKCLIDGKMREVSAWLRKSANGTEFISLAFREKTNKVDMP